MRSMLAMAAAMVLSFPALSRAQISLGARIGYAPGLGAAEKDIDTGEKVKMSDTFKSQIPIQIEGAFRLTPAVALGAYLSYGFGQLGGAMKDDCDAASLTCSASDLRFGIQAFYTFAGLSPQFVPWAGVGIGYEWGKLDLARGGDEATLTYKGWEFVNLQLGGDIPLTPAFSVGPYVMLSVAQYSTGELESGGASISGDIESKAVHEWLGFGIRGKFDL